MNDVIQALNPEHAPIPPPAEQWDIPVVTRGADIPDEWAWLDCGVERWLVRRLDAERYVGVAPFLFTHALVWGYCDDLDQKWASPYVDRWCYAQDQVTALAYATIFDGPEGEHQPADYIRHVPAPGSTWRPA